MSSLIAQQYSNELVLILATGLAMEGEREFFCENLLILTVWLTPSDRMVGTGAEEAQFMKVIIAPGPASLVSMTQLFAMYIVEIQICATLLPSSNRTIRVGTDERTDGTSDFIID